GGVGAGRAMFTREGSARISGEEGGAAASSLWSCSSPHRGRIVARKPTELASLSPASTVSSVACPLTKRTRAAARTRREPSAGIILSAARHVGCDHLLRVDDAVEFDLGDESQLQGGRLQREI